eukprot:CAMPEP_0197520902 /NCGR_PEP_ID=MMETSP1318-20131121/6225_1 /TAXON_ID=552666 /ORGANISM="Partenskyella glossopodia, Strain RCC365" /LENGTH=413 /DNA_ID=CAMNT_0043072667 /DNA_START=173 /DNA_END=1414 /DNA_ORIENTATION=+
MASVPLTLFASSWTSGASNGTYLVTSGGSDGSAATYSVYPYGVDWNWYHKANELAFFNSLKMKMSVILGVTHMVVGICLSALNYIFFKDFIGFWSEWLPRLIFMLATFGYMCIIIIVKWSTNYECQNNTDPFSLSCPNPDKQPPALIQTMIKMFLSPGNVPPDLALYEGQAFVQGFLICIAVLTIPVMLFAKPVVVHMRSKNKRRRRENGNYRSIAGSASDVDSDHELHVMLSSRAQNSMQSELVSHYDDLENGSHSHDAKVAAVRSQYSSSVPERAEQCGDSDGDDHDDGMGEALIHQGIHTIEFVLGAVSNTASYLRLWALSLAHAQLAKVFWSKMIIEYGVESGGALMLVCGYAVWAFATFGVLLCMDLLECFLHALRLHWVEFQNKFYHGDGLKFQPFRLPTDHEDLDE